MQDKANIILNDDQLTISGVINFTTAVNLFQKSLPLLNNLKKFAFNFSAVTHANSALLALLIEWIKIAKQEKKSIEFQNLSPQLVSIINISGVDKLII